MASSGIPAASTTPRVVVVAIDQDPEQQPDRQQTEHRQPPRPWMRRRGQQRQTEREQEDEQPDQGVGHAAGQRVGHREVGPPADRSGEQRQQGGQTHTGRRPRPPRRAARTASCRRAGDRRAPSRGPPGRPPIAPPPPVGGRSRFVAPAREGPVATEHDHPLPVRERLHARGLQGQIRGVDGGQHGPVTIAELGLGPAPARPSCRRPHSTHSYAGSSRRIVPCSSITEVPSWVEATTVSPKAVSASSVPVCGSSQRCRPVRQIESLQRGLLASHQGVTEDHPAGAGQVLGPAAGHRCRRRTPWSGHPRRRRPPPGCRPPAGR